MARNLSQQEKRIVDFMIQGMEVKSHSTDAFHSGDNRSPAFGKYQASS